MRSAIGSAALLVVLAALADLLLGQVDLVFLFYISNIFPTFIIEFKMFTKFK